MTKNNGKSSTYNGWLGDRTIAMLVYVRERKQGGNGTMIVNVCVMPKRSSDDHHMIER